MNPTGRLDVLIMRLADRLAPAVCHPDEWRLLRPSVARWAARKQRRLTRG